MNHISEWYMLDLLKTYFQAFENKDIEALKVLYHDNVELHEVSIRSYLGKEKVLEANMVLFHNVPKIQIKLINQAVVGNTVFNEIELHDGNRWVPIVDIITFEGDKIIQVKAYVA